jgi:hypothetical protein
MRAVQRNLPGAWLHVLAQLMEHGQASTQEMADAGRVYTLRTVGNSLSSMLPVQHCGRKTWGLTKAGIEAALQAEKEAAEQGDKAALWQISRSF